MSRYRITETRQITFDSQWEPKAGDDPEELALEEARALPDREWDHLQADVVELVDRALSFKDDLRSRLDEDEGRADEEEARLQAWEWRL